MSSDAAWELVRRRRALPEAERERHFDAIKASAKLPADERAAVSAASLRASLRAGGAS